MSAVFDGPVAQMMFWSSPNACAASAIVAKICDFENTATCTDGARDAERIVVDAGAVVLGADREFGAEKRLELRPQRGVAIAAHPAAGLQLLHHFGGIGQREAIVGLDALGKHGEQVAVAQEGARLGERGIPIGKGSALRERRQGATHPGEDGFAVGVHGNPDFLQEVAEEAERELDLRNVFYVFAAICLKWVGW